MTPCISVIVPVLNEEARVAELLAQLSAIPALHEVIVVDGGSRDRTREIVARYPTCRLVRSPRGRAVQMNAGADWATGDVLLFLHADVTLPPGTPRIVARILSEPGVVAGAFRTRTVADRGGTWSRAWLRLADMRSRYSKLPYGDQALFVRRRTFLESGGFPRQPLFEDLEISRRLSRLGRIRIAAEEVRVSGRRFMARPFYYCMVMNTMPLLYRLGVPVATLTRAYPDVR